MSAARVLSLIVVAMLSSPGCYLSHERDSDAGTASSDARLELDSGSPRANGWPDCEPGLSEPPGPTFCAGDYPGGRLGFITETMCGCYPSCTSLEDCPNPGPEYDVQCLHYSEPTGACFIVCVDDDDCPAPLRCIEPPTTLTRFTERMCAKVLDE